MNITTKQQIQQLEFLSQTALHFTSKNRGVKKKCEHGTCSYVDGCAIGRHITKRLATLLDKKEFSAVHRDEVFNRLPKWLRSLGKNFLSSIQSFHDIEGHWDREGLTEAGMRQYATITKDILAGTYLTQ